MKELNTPTDDGLAVLLLGNADIECERGLPSPDDTTCTLPIYPHPGDLPALHIER